MGEEVATPKTLLLSFADMISETVRIKKLIGRVIQRGCTCQLFGPSGDGKTFVAIGMGLAVATGTEWNGYQCEQGLVIYFNGEGREGFKLRCRAWRKHHNITGSVHFYSSRSAIEFNAVGLQQVKAEVRALEERTGQKVALVIIDTLARHLIGDENSTQHMSEFIKQVDGLRDMFPDSSALIVHHTGVNTEATGRARGSSALKASVDVEIQCMKYVLTFTKMKDAAPPAPIGFKLKVIDLGFDDDGESITSCVLEYGEAPVKKQQSPKMKLKGQNQTLYRLLSKHPTGDIEAIRPLFYAQERARKCDPDIKTGTLKTAYGRAIDKLIEVNMITCDGDTLHIIETAQTAQTAQTDNLSPIVTAQTAHTSLGSVPNVPNKTSSEINQNIDDVESRDTPSFDWKD
jgi:hypothetical protein